MEDIHRYPGKISEAVERMAFGAEPMRDLVNKQEEPITEELSKKERIEKRIRTIQERMKTIRERNCDMDGDIKELVEWNKELLNLESALIKEEKPWK